jgi:hypothetical protein
MEVGEFIGSYTFYQKVPGKRILRTADVYYQEPSYQAYIWKDLGLTGKERGSGDTPEEAVENLRDLIDCPPPRP